MTSRRLATPGDERRARVRFQSRRAVPTVAMASYHPRGPGAGGSGVSALSSSMSRRSARPTGRPALSAIRSGSVSNGTGSLFSAAGRPKSMSSMYNSSSSRSPYGHHGLVGYGGSGSTGYLSALTTYGGTSSGYGGLMVPSSSSSSSLNGQASPARKSSSSNPYVSNSYSSSSGGSAGNYSSNRSNSNTQTSKQRARQRSRSTPRPSSQSSSALPSLSRSGSNSSLASNPRSEGYVVSKMFEDDLSLCCLSVLVIYHGEIRTHSRVCSVS